MRTRRVELTETWPSLRLEIELAPWHWLRLWFYRDDVERRCWRIVLGPLTVECMANTPLFSIEDHRAALPEPQEDRP